MDSTEIDSCRKETERTSDAVSYNIDTWKVKKLNGLTIPLASFFKHPRTDWHPDKEYDENGLLTLQMMESHVKGRIKGGILHVTEIEIWGEGSGTVMSWLVEPALRDSRGELVASCVWEGGDSINQIIVKNGAVEWKDIEI